MIVIYEKNIGAYVASQNIKRKEGRDFFVSRINKSRIHAIVSATEASIKIKKSLWPLNYVDTVNTTKNRMKKVCV